MLTEQKLLNRFNQTALNFKFKLGEDFKPFFQIIFEKTKHITEAEIDKKFQQLWLIPAADWNKKYGFAGYPALSDWLDILVGQRPKTDEQLREEHRRWEQSINNHIAVIKCWLNDRNFMETKPQYYHYTNSDNEHLKKIIDDAYKNKNYTKEFTKEQILSLFLKIRGEYLTDKQVFTHKLKKSALTVSPEPLLPSCNNRVVALPNFKKEFYRTLHLPVS
jgi:hypothetical protein